MFKSNLVFRELFSNKYKIGIQIKDILVFKKKYQKW